MNKLTIAFLLVHLFLRSIAFAAAEDTTGALREVSPGRYELFGETRAIPIEFTSDVQKAIPSLLGKSPFVKVLRGQLENGVLKSSEVPTFISGDQILEGRLTLTQNGYQLAGRPAHFGPTKFVTSASFDKKSESYFVDKEVRAVGVFKDQTFVIHSILRNDVFTADTDSHFDADVPTGLKKSFEAAPVETAISMLNPGGAAPSPQAFRKTLFSKSTQPPRPGTTVLLISASGGQGDSKGSVNGHMAIGIGEVGPDLKIRGEMFNVYVTNEKEIVPGNVELNDYFGHLISGQQNYRPTYTVAFYGIELRKLLRVKAELDRFHPMFRSGSTKITSVKNCATLSVQALADIDFYGLQRNGRNGQGGFKLLSKQSSLPPESLFDEVRFVSKTKRAEFMPGPAVQSYLENLEYLTTKESLSIERVDFFFAGQTPSSRRFGYGPTTGIANQLKQQGLVETKIRKHRRQK